MTKTSSKKSGNGKHATPPELVPVTSEEAAGLRAMETELAELARQLGELTLQAMGLEARKLELGRTVQTLRAQRDARAKELAERYALVGSYHLDMAAETIAFRRKV